MAALLARVLEWFPRPFTKTSTIVEQDLSTIDLWPFFGVMDRNYGITLLPLPYPLLLSIFGTRGGCHLFFPPTLPSLPCCLPTCIIPGYGFFLGWSVYGLWLVSFVHPSLGAPTVMSQNNGVIDLLHCDYLHSALPYSLPLRFIDL